MTSCQPSQSGTRPWASMSRADWQSSLTGPAKAEAESWTVLTTDASLCSWVAAQHRNLNSVFAAHAGSVLP